MAHGAPWRRKREERHDAEEDPLVYVRGRRCDEDLRGDNPDDDGRDRRRSLAEPVGEFAELRPEQRGRDGVDGRERAGDRVVAVDLLHADGNGHADHGERHARDHRPNGEARRMRDAQQLGIPAEQPVDQAGVPAGAVGAVAPRSSASSISMASSVDSMILPRSRRMDGAPMQSGHRRAICAHMVLG